MFTFAWGPMCRKSVIKLEHKVLFQIGRCNPTDPAKTKILVLLSASLERFGVSFLLRYLADPGKARGYSTNTSITD